MTVSQIVPVTSWTLVEVSVLQGSSVLFVNGRLEAYTLDTQDWPQRAIEDPQLETSLKGAHQRLRRKGWTKYCVDSPQCHRELDGNNATGV